MAFDVALTAAEQTALNAGGHTIQRYLSVYQPAALYTGTISALDYLSGGVWPIQGYTMGSNVPTTVKRGMTAKVVSAGGVIRGYYRVVNDGAASPGLYLGYLAEQDTGLLSIGYRTAAASVGDTVIIYNRYDFWSAAPYYDSSILAWTEDSMSYSAWQSAVLADNRYPRIAVNIGKHRSQFVDTGQTYATMTFTAVLVFWVSSAVTYAWDIPGSWTVTAGSSSAASFTAQVPAGSYVLSLDVTHDTSRHSISRRMVWVHDTGANAPIPIAEVTSDVRDRTGRQMTIGVNNNALASIPEGSMVNYFEVCTWGGTDVPTATTNFTGWITRENWRINQGIRRTDLGIMGPADMLKLAPAFSQYLTYNAAPSDFTQNYYTSIFYVIYDLLWKRSPNILGLFDFNAVYMQGSPLSFTQVYNMVSWAIPQGSNLLEQIQALANSARLNYGHSSTGAIFVAERPNEVAVASRSAVAATRDYLTTNRYTWPIQFERKRKPEYRRTLVRGFYSDGTSTTGVLAAEAPFGAIGQGNQEDTINDYICSTSSLAASQTEIKSRAGQIQSSHNNPRPDVPFFIPDNRDVYEPAEMQFVQSDMPAGQSPDDTGWTGDNGVPLRVVKKHNNNGTAQIELHLEMETAGIAGGLVTIA